VTEDGLLGPTPPPLASDGPDDLDILLLMKPPEAAFCAAALAKHDPALRIARAGDLEILRAGAARAGRRARLIGFSTAIVVPGALLPAFAGGAYNFHPGPPEFPGNRPSAFACHAEAPTFGVTFHRMEAKVDSGEILDCERFSTAGLRTASELAIKAYQHLARLFLRKHRRSGQPRHTLDPDRRNLVGTQDDAGGFRGDAGGPRRHRPRGTRPSRSSVQLGVHPALTTL
jgi:hypothetical protein